MKKIFAAALVAVMSLGAYGAFAGEETAGAAGLYVLVNDGGASVWEESNDVEGLQTTATGENGEIPPDTKIA